MSSANTDLEQCSKIRNNIGALNITVFYLNTVNFVRNESSATTNFSVK